MNHSASGTRVNLVQARLHWSDPASNREHLSELINNAPDADLYVLPETFTTGFLGEAKASDEGMDGATVSWLQELAESRSAAICGSAVIVDDHGRRNRFLLAEPSGNVHFYDKRHLFSFAGEDKRYQAGTERVVVPWNDWKVCPQICYDLRFPVWCRTRGDYDLLIFVANWPTPRVAAWDALLRARAIENQCFVVAVNRVGEDGKGVQYPGHSAIYDPFGNAVVEPWEEEGVRQGVIDLNAVREVRRDFPFSADADAFSLK